MQTPYKPHPLVLLLEKNTSEKNAVFFLTDSNYFKTLVKKYIFQCYCSMANGILFFASVLRQMGLQKMFNLRMTPTIFLLFFLLPNYD